LQLPGEAMDVVHKNWEKKMGEDQNSDALREKERKKNETEKNDQILIAF
jgi:hypothetical protein